MTQTTDTLLEKLLEASRCEQTKDFDRARLLYEEILSVDAAGFHGTSARKALEVLATKARPAIAADPVLISQPPVSANLIHEGQHWALYYWKRLKNGWRDLGFANKLTLLLVIGSTVPVAIATVFLISRTQERVQEDFVSQLQSDASAWKDDYVGWTEDDSATEAENLAQLVQAVGVNLDQPTQVQRNRTYLTALVTEALSAGDRNRADVTKSFRILTDAKGRTVTQGIKIHQASKESTYPPIPDPDREIDPAEFQLLNSQAGIDLSSAEIVREVLETGQPQRGIEVLPGDTIQQLGLAAQASIPPRGSLDPTLPAAPSNTYDLDDYQAGLSTVVVYPVKLGDRVVGTAIVGVLHNRHHALLDEFQQLYDSKAISVFAYNWRVNTNIDMGDGTRAIGTFAPEVVSDAILENGQDSVTQFENINGTNYQVLYRPLYNHNKRIDPEAKPVGMISVAKPQTELEKLVRAQQLLGLAVGGGAALVVSTLAFFVARAFARSIGELADFAQQVGSGERGARLQATERQDEIGILAQELNQMAVSIEANIDAVRQQEELRRQEAEQQRAEKERLQKGVVNLLLEIEGAQRGDLTVNAPVTDGAVGSIADAFNTTIRRLRMLVGHVQTVARRVDELATGSAPSMQRVSQEASVQSAEIAQSVATVNQIGELIRTVDKSAQQAALVAQRGAKAAREGEEVMDMTVTSIKKISSAVAETASKVDRLTESFKQILQILTIISGIAERTNLLAYNASIEASRAGENGQGFRVVAEEVRRLAGRATEATRSIEQIVEIIQQDTVEVQQAMEVGKSEVAEGTELVAQTKQTLKGLAEISQSINEYLQAISSNTNSQSEASAQVNQLMERVETIAQSTAERVQEVAESLQELVFTASTLTESVSQFRLEK
jgi:twitching motility protein PilJ